MKIASALWVDEIRRHEDGRIDLLGLFEDLYVPKLPVTVESLSLYLEAEFEPGDRGKRHTIALRLVDPDGVTLQEPSRIRFVAPTEAEYPRPTAPLDPALFEITFRRTGMHHLEIEADGAIVRRLCLHVAPVEER